MVDTWFLVVLVAALGGFFIWAMQRILAGLEGSIGKLDASFQKTAGKMETLIEELFSHRNNHENRIVALETRCDMQHGIVPQNHTPQRQSGGRRAYDPATPPEEHV